MSKYTSIYHNRFMPAAIFCGFCCFPRPVKKGLFSAQKNVYCVLLIQKRMKTVLFWLLALGITLAAVVYQRATGPTYDKETTVKLAGKEYRFHLVRSHGGNSGCPVMLEVADREVTGMLKFRPYPTRQPWQTVQMERQGDTLSAVLPHLPPAGKYEYLIMLSRDGQTVSLNNGEPVIIRFKGDVPAAILVPHIFLMFFAMFLANLAGIMAAFRHPQFRLFTKLTLVFLFFGGLLFGPWVQWHAFGEAWAGVPFAWDLTDNKTLVAFLFWVLAYAMNRKKERPAYTIAAAVVMLVIYCIPHSMYGSQLDPETGEIIQGWILSGLLPC